MAKQKTTDRVVGIHACGHLAYRCRWVNPPEQRLRETLCYRCFFAHIEHRRKLLRQAEGKALRKAGPEGPWLQGLLRLQQHWQETGHIDDELFDALFPTPQSAIVTISVALRRCAEVRHDVN